MSEPMLCGYRDWEWRQEANALALYGSRIYDNVPRSLKLCEVATYRQDEALTVVIDRVLRLAPEDFAALSRLVLAKLQELQRAKEPQHDPFAHLEASGEWEPHTP